MKPFHLASFALALLPLSPSFAGTARTEAPPVVTGETDVPGDFNEDGQPDLLWQDSATGNFFIWIMSRTQPVDTAVVDAPGDPAFIAVGTDDFDGNDRTDIVLWNPPTGDLVFWLMDGTKLLSKVAVDLDLPEYEPVSVLDHDRDGSPDILFQNRKGDDLLMVLFRNTVVVAKFPIIVQSPTDRDWRVVGSGDFDADGDSDLVLQTGNGAVAVALMNGNTGTLVDVREVGDRNWRVAAVADFTADNDTDIFFENLRTGETAVWEMRGLAITAQYVVTGPTTQGRGWHIVGPN